MDVKEIIGKTELTQEEMQFVVEQYIFEKKGKKVKIDIMSNPVINLVPPMMQRPLIQRELSMLNEAYNIACEYFFNKEEK
jgi:hypothetical protein